MTARATGRRGFTLLELLLALLLAGVVALLVYGAAQAALETQERLATHRRAAQVARAARVLLQDALRNARPALRPGEQGFVLDAGRAPDGRPADRLTFVAAGGLPPLTDDALWAVTVSAEADGLALLAAPLGMRAEPRRIGHLPGVTGLEVQVLGRGARDGWAARWPYPSLLPRAVRLVLWDSAGPAGPPVHVALARGGAR